MKRPPYYIEHAFVSLAIFLVVGLVFGLSSGYCSGIAFYAGREYVQWEMLGYFDWKGLVAPLVGNTIVFLAWILS